MSDLNGNVKENKYLIHRKPSEIKIDKDQIFYREKYNEVMNYIKVLLASSKETDFEKFFKLKGTLLISAPIGTDIIDFIKLISNNYYLDYNELNFREVAKNPKEFISNFSSIISHLIRFDKSSQQSKKEKILKEDFRESDSNTKESKRNEGITLILIEEQTDFKKKLNGDQLLSKFLIDICESNVPLSYIEKGIIIVWVNHDYNKIRENADKIYDYFDLFLKIPRINKSERETILRSFNEKFPNISYDINILVNRSENWEVKDLNRLLKTGILKHHLNSDLNEVSNEITDILLNLIESGEFIPTISIKAAKKPLKNKEFSEEMIKKQSKRDGNVFSQESSQKAEKSIINAIKEESSSEFMVNQLYEDAASRNYNELIIIADKLEKSEQLSVNDRKILAKYPFILNDPPKLAKINLEKGKKRIDLIKKALGG